MNLNTMGSVEREGFTFLISWFCFNDNLSESKASYCAKPKQAFEGQELLFHSVIVAFFFSFFASLLHLRIGNFTTMLKTNFTLI
jgi:hypothetical protein